MSTRVKAWVVSHTHWDREWYATREQFRVMLLSAVDRLFAILESDPGFRTFMLDGQAIVLEDYCEAKPGSRALLSRLIREGRILVGPWYVLPDEYLVTGEAHIRNYLIGTRICDELGGSMRVGYLPDSFGHPSQMPQILRGLGLEEIVFWRGLGPDVTETELTWQGRDGTEVFGLNMPFSYGIAACLPEEPDAFVQRLRQKIGMLAPLTRTGCILLMQGVDHVAPPVSLTRNLDYAAKRLPDMDLVHGSLPDFLQAVRRAPVDWQRTSGELRSGYRAYLLGGTISTRMPLKQHSHRASVLLERSLETMAAMAWARGAMVHPSQEIRHAWKLFLANMPHDSICGCSVDEVHAEMTARLRSMEEYAEALLQRCVGAVEAAMAAPGVTAGSPAVTPRAAAVDGRCLVLNALGHERSDLVRTTVRFDQSLLRKVNYETGALEEYEAHLARTAPTGVMFIGPDGRETTGSLGQWVERDVMKLSEDTQPQMARVREAPATFVAASVPPLGVAVFAYRFTFGAPDTRQRPSRVENEYLAAQWDTATATLVLHDKRTGRTFHGLAAVEDTGDAGDEYTWSAPLQDSRGAVDPASVRTQEGDGGQSSTLYASIVVPERLAPDRRSRASKTIGLPFEITMSVVPGVPRLDLRVVLENRAEDHRLRLLFPTGMAAASASSEGVFSVDDRPVTRADAGIPAGWVEPPSTHPQKCFVSVSDGTAGLTVANRGLPEYEVIDNGGALVAVTLLRCVGWLSRPDLLARKGNGGWTLPTPGAQCTGRHVFELSLIPHAGDWDTGGGGRAARAFEVPLRAFDLDAASAAGTFSLAGVDRPEIVVSAVKGAETGGSVIMRCWNSSPREVGARISAGFPVSRAFLVSLSEEREGSLPVTNGGVDVAFGPWKIRSVELVPAAPGAGKAAARHGSSTATAHPR